MAPSVPQDRGSPRSLQIGNPQALGISTLHCTLKRLEAETLEDLPATWIRTHAPDAEPLALGGRPARLLRPHQRACKVGVARCTEMDR